VTDAVGSERPLFLDVDGDGLLDAVGANTRQFLANQGPRLFPEFRPEMRQPGSVPAVIAGIVR
jgi:hypothetical protein